MTIRKMTMMNRNTDTNIKRKITGNININRKRERYIKCPEDKPDNENDKRKEQYISEGKSGEHDT